MTTALERYNEHIADEPITDPIEALRFFCSLSMNGNDWLDVEPFFDAVIQERTLICEKNARFKQVLGQIHLAAGGAWVNKKWIADTASKALEETK